LTVIRRKLQVVLSGIPLMANEILPSASATAVLDKPREFTPEDTVPFESSFSMVTVYVSPVVKG
jgi:hypothetical protein